MNICPISASLRAYLSLERERGERDREREIEGEREKDRERGREKERERPYALCVCHYFSAIESGSSGSGDDAPAASVVGVSDAGVLPAFVDFVAPLLLILLELAPILSFFIDGLVVVGFGVLSLAVRVFDGLLYSVEDRKFSSGQPTHTSSTEAFYLQP